MAAFPKKQWISCGSHGWNLTVNLAWDYAIEHGASIGVEYEKCRTLIKFTKHENIGVVVEDRIGRDRERKLGLDVATRWFSKVNVQFI